jgi:hypothetical protein
MPAMVAFAVACGQASDTCRDALDVVCSCDSTDCSEDTASHIVFQLRACVREDQYQSDPGVPICIQESAEQYCAVADALASGGDRPCSLSCDEDLACDLRAACQDHQYKRCDVNEEP